VKNMTCQLTNC